MNKKGVVFEAVTFIPRLIFLTVVFLSIFFLVAAFVQTEVNTFPAESQILLHRLLISDGGFAYKDSLTNRVYPFIVDKNKNADKSIYYGDKQKDFAASISSVGFTVHYNKFGYDRLSPRQDAENTFKLWGFPLYIYEGRSLRPQSSYIEIIGARE